MRLIKPGYGLYAISAVAGLIALFLAFTVTQKTVRRDRCWSVWIKLKPCDITLDDVFVHSITHDTAGMGHRSDALRARPELVILQWCKELPSPPDDWKEGDPPWQQDGYTIMDLFADMGRKIYVIAIRGHRLDTKAPVAAVLWISMAGAAQHSLSPPPIRTDRRTSLWSNEDQEALIQWLGDHDWMHRDIFRDPRIAQGSFLFLKHKFDHRIEMPFLLGGNCKPIQGDGGL